MSKPVLAAIPLMLFLASVHAQLPDTLKPAEFSKPTICPTGYDFTNNACTLAGTLGGTLDP